MAIKPYDIHQMDCLKGLARLTPGRVDLAFADPPFNIGYDYDAYDDRQDSDAYLDWSRKWMSGVIKALKPTGTFWLAIGDEYAAELKLIATSELGLTCRSWVVWYYTFGVNCKMKFSRSHVHLFHFIKDPKRFTFNFKDPAIRVPSARQLVYADGRANPHGRLPDDTWILRPQDLPDGFQPHEDTWYVPRVCGTFKQRRGWHGCQMPEQLLGRIIRACSNEGDLVLDPFAGSGTTLAVAKKLGRDWLGFELSEKYVAQIKKRMRAAKPGDPLEGAAEPLVSAPATPADAQPTRPRKASARTRAGKQPAPVGPRPERATARHGGLDGDIAIAIKRAYWAASRGFSTDRVLADPALNADFAVACKDLRIPGSLADWNHRLLGLRKASKLNELPKAKRTIIPRNDLDDFTFASEIAWSLLSARLDLSLDEILCNPAHVQEFDGIAERLAPGWSSFHYRWGALYIRKEAHVKRRLATKIPSRLRGIQFPRRVRRIDGFRRIPAGPGLYLLKVGADNFYVGETSGLGDRIEKQVSQDAIEAMQIRRADARLALLPLGVAPEDRWGAQSRLMRVLRPRANWSKQFVA